MLLHGGSYFSKFRDLFGGVERHRSEGPASGNEATGGPRESRTTVRACKTNCLLGAVTFFKRVRRAAKSPLKRRTSQIRRSFHVYDDNVFRNCETVSSGTAQGCARDAGATVQACITHCLPGVFLTDAGQL